MLEKAHLRKAMGSLEHPITFKQSDKRKVLITNIVESMRTQEVAASSVVEMLQGSVVKQGPVKGAPVVHVDKKRKTEFGAAAATATMETQIENASTIASGESSTAVKQDSDVALTAAPTSSNSNAMELDVVGGGSVISSTHTEQPTSAATGTFGSQHLASVLNAAFSSTDTIGKLVDGVKSKSEAFKGLAKSKRVDHKSVNFSKMQLAESIAKCRPTNRAQDCGNRGTIGQYKVYALRQNSRHICEAVQGCASFVR